MEQVDMRWSMTAQMEQELELNKAVVENASYEALLIMAVAVLEVLREKHNFGRIRS